MFHGTYDRARRADRYRAVAAEYNRLSKTATDPYLASYYPASPKTIWSDPRTNCVRWRERISPC
jgi:hypothetical protein